MATAKKKKFTKYASKAQERWANTAAGVKALGKKRVNRLNKASKGKKLPARAKRKK